MEAVWKKKEILFFCNTHNLTCCRKFGITKSFLLLRAIVRSLSTTRTSRIPRLWTSAQSVDKSQTAIARTVSSAKPKNNKKLNIFVFWILEIFYVACVVNCEEIFQSANICRCIQAKCILLTRAIPITTTTNNTRVRGGQGTAGQKPGKGMMITGKLLITTTGETSLTSHWRPGSTSSLPSSRV